MKAKWILGRLALEPRWASACRILVACHSAAGKALVTRSSYSIHAPNQLLRYRLTAKMESLVPGARGFGCLTDNHLLLRPWYNTYPIYPLLFDGLRILLLGCSWYLSLYLSASSPDFGDLSRSAAKARIKSAVTLPWSRNKSNHAVSSLAFDAADSGNRYFDMFLPRRDLR